MKTDQFIISRLLGRIWHSTTMERFERIKADGFLRPEPDIPESERWSTNRGPEWFPFVRHIGGFSLFDFPIGFDLTEYRRRCPSSSLDELIPFRSVWRHAVWLEIDRERQASSLRSGLDVWARCEAEGRGKRCMPHIEGAHIGDMPVSSILRAYLIEEGDSDWRLI